MNRKSLQDKTLISGDERARTVNPRLAKPVLSQLSYVPKTLFFRTSLDRTTSGDTIQ